MAVKYPSISKIQSVYYLGYTVPRQLSTFVGTLENKCLLLRVQFKCDLRRIKYTPNIEPVPLIEVVGLQTTIAVVQAVLIGSTVGCRRPPGPERGSIAERAIGVVPAVNRIIGGSVASDATLLAICW